MSSSRELGRHDARSAAAAALGVSEDEFQASAALTSALKEHWSELEPEAQFVARALALLGGAAGESWLLAEATNAACTSGLYGEAAARQAVTGATETLWESGLISRDRETREYFLVPELAEGLVEIAKAEWASDLREVPPPQSFVDEHVLCCAFNLLRRAPTRLTRQGRPYKRTLDEISSSLTGLLPKGATSKAADGLLTTLRQLGMLNLQEDELLPCPDAANEWANLPERERALRLVHGDDDSNDALILLKQLQSLSASARFPQELAQSLFRAVTARAGLEGPCRGFTGQCEERFRIAVDLLERGGLLASKIEGDGLALTVAGRVHPEPPPRVPAAQFHVAEDLSVMAPRGLPPTTHLALGALARLEAGDVVARYHVDRDLVLAALDDGAEPEEILEFLSGGSRTGLPGVARSDIERWCERFGEVAAYEGIAIVCRLQNRHGEFEALVGACGLKIQLVASGVAIIHPADHEAFHRILVSAGFAPRRRLSGPDESANSPWAGIELKGCEPDSSSSAGPWDELPAWNAELAAGSGRQATPPPQAFAALLSEKYRREFGSIRLAELGRLPLHDLLEMEERGLIRRFLSGSGTATVTVTPPTLAEFQGEEPIAVSGKRTELLLDLARVARRACEMLHVRSPGRPASAVLVPLELIKEGDSTYVRGRCPGSKQDRLILVQRISAVRVLPAEE